MKNKLQLAIASITLPIVLQLVLNVFSSTLFNHDDFGIRDLLYFIMSMSPLGTLPFFIALYNSKKFNELIANENAAANYDKNENSGDESWLKHVIIRIGIILGICYGLYSMSYTSSGFEIAYFIAYAIVAAIGLSFIGLIIEAFLLFRKKRLNKLFCNLIMIGALLFFGINLL